AGHSDGRGLGAEFTVRLPLGPPLPDPRKTGEHPALRHEADRRALKVLVVDDNRDAAESLCMLLEALGLEVACAYDGASALELAAEFHPDVCLLDVGMPGMDGWTLGRRLRDDPAHEGVVIAAMTGWGEDRDRRRAAEAGFDHHFSKPADIRALTRMLEAVPPR